MRLNYAIQFYDGELNRWERGQGRSRGKGGGAGLGMLVEGVSLESDPLSFVGTCTPNFTLGFELFWYEVWHELLTLFVFLIAGFVVFTDLK